MQASILDHLVSAKSLRHLGPDETPRVTTMELFFDLVYVFTIIQLSHYLLTQLSWTGALEALTLYAAIWWAWNYTAWAANWIDPDRAGGRNLMIALMACALTMAAAIPEAYSDRAGLFVGAYVAMALLRAAFMALAFRGQTMGRNYLQLGLWSAISGVFWIVGVLLPEYRLSLWIAAVVIDYAAPYKGFWIPGMGATPMDSWPLKGLHLFERNQLIFIIALGESILLLGAMLIKHELHASFIAAAGIGFALIVSLWSIYFMGISERGEHKFHDSADHTSLARAGLAYAHGIMVCGAIVVAVAIEMIVAHPTDPIHGPTAIVAVAGPSIFLLGCILFHRTIAESFRKTYVIAMAAFGAWGLAAALLHLSGLWLGAGMLLVMLGLAVLDSRPDTGT